MLLIAMMLFLVGTFLYYRAVVQIREHLNKVRPDRRPSRKFFAVEEIALVSNPIRMYRFIFQGQDEIVVEPLALLKIRKIFIASSIVSVCGTVLFAVNVLLR
jgi:hypothetical protein